MKTEYGYIYVLTCLITMKEYVGQAKCWKKRWKRHCADARGDSLFAIHCAIRTYGKENFALTILRRCPIEEMDYWEEYYVEKHDTLAPDGYNLTTGGDGSKASEDTRIRLSNALKAYWGSLTEDERGLAVNRRARSEETIEKCKKTWKKNLVANSEAIGRGMRDAWQRPEERVKRTEVFRTPEYRAAASIRRLTFEATPKGAETRCRVSMQLKGRKLSDVTRNRMRTSQRVRRDAETTEDREVTATTTREACKKRSKKQHQKINAKISAARIRVVITKTPEELRAASKKSWVTRRANLAKKV